MIYLGLLLPLLLHLPFITHHISLALLHPLSLDSPAGSPWIDTWQTPEPPVTVDLTRELSHVSSPAAPDTDLKSTGMASRTDNFSLSSVTGSSVRHTAMVRSQSQQTPVSHRKPLAPGVLGHRQYYGPQHSQIRLDHVNEYTPSEYAKQCLDDFQDRSNVSTLSLALSADPALNGIQHQLQISTPEFPINPNGLSNQSLVAFKGISSKLLYYYFYLLRISTFY